MPSRSWIPTPVFSRAYLAATWKHRAELKDYERRGFAQFVYLTICAHLENFLAQLIQGRLKSIRYLTNWEALAPETLYSDGEHVCDRKPVYESLLRLVSSLSDETHLAPLIRLTERYNLFFQRPLRDVIGQDLHEDLLAIGALRNLFAHGRDLFLEFPDDEGYATLESNPLQKPAVRLQKAGILTTLKVTGMNRPEFNATFYSDEALLYFYRAVERIQEQLTLSIDFLPEASGFPFSQLPKLEAKE